MCMWQNMDLMNCYLKYFSYGMCEEKVIHTVLFITFIWTRIYDSVPAANWFC
jgi:hypothetical protein